MSCCYTPHPKPPCLRVLCVMTEDMLSLLAYDPSWDTWLMNVHPATGPCMVWALEGFLLASKKQSIIYHRTVTQVISVWSVR